MFFSLRKLNCEETLASADFKCMCYENHSMSCVIGHCILTDLKEINKITLSLSKTFGKYRHVILLYFIVLHSFLFVFNKLNVATLH